MTKFEAGLKNILKRRQRYISRGEGLEEQEAIDAIKSLINTEGLGKDKNQFNASHDLRYYEQRGFNSANAEARVNMGITKE